MRTRPLPACAAAAAFALGLSFATPAVGDTPAAPAVAGEQWEVTSQMTMEGMPFPMPVTTNKVCSTNSEPPVSDPPDGDCQMTDLTTVGSTTTWTAQCTGEHPMTGRGEITYNGSDSYTGQIRFESADGVMTLKLSGKKLGACTR
jgi:hypothetical protein